MLDGLRVHFGWEDHSPLARPASREGESGGDDFGAKTGGMSVWVEQVAEKLNFFISLKNAWMQDGRICMVAARTKGEGNAADGLFSAACQITKCGLVEERGRLCWKR